MPGASVGVHAQWHIDWYVGGARTRAVVYVTSESGLLGWRRARPDDLHETHGGGGDAPAATPEAGLAAALKKAPSLGTLWTSETVGYSVKFAYRETLQGGGERITLLTERRVGAWSNLWKPTVDAPAMDYPFSIIEFRLNAAGAGEGRGAVVGKVAIDSQAKTIALDSYNTLPVIFKGVKRQG